MTTDEKTLTPVDVEAITAGGAAIRSWMEQHDPDVSKVVFTSDTEEMAQAAIEASGKVYAAAEEAEAERLVAETGLASMEVIDGAASLKLVLAHELAVNMATAFQTILDAHPSATNYVEQEFFPRGSRDPYVFVVCKPGGKTPHQLRREAEAQRDKLLDLVDELYSEEPCWFDHHGYCQEHGSNRTDVKCPHARARELLAEHRAAS